jgi:hypothetical protein
LIFVRVIDACVDEAAFINEARWTSLSVQPLRASLRVAGCVEEGWKMSLWLVVNVHLPK